MRYVALSYVWGDSTRTDSTTTSSLRKLLRPGAFRSKDCYIPATVLDTIELIKNIGERYLWVDRYCIIQDEDDAKQKQLAAMGHVYANAYFTLIAAESADASHGLCGSRAMKPHSLRHTFQQLFPSQIRNVPSTRCMLAEAVNLVRSTWFSRGWTFQEYLFSSRKVIFINDSVSWECLCSAWHELQYRPKISKRKSDLRFARDVPVSDHLVAPTSGLTFTPWPDMHRYFRLVTLFNERNLTYPEDVLDAFMGILKAASGSFKGGLLSGLPILCFDAALLWQPWTPLQRRVSKKISSDQAILPSWSWVGWKGEMETESWRSASSFQLMQYGDKVTREQCSWETISTVSWSWSNDLDSTPQSLTTVSDRSQITSEHTGPQLPTSSSSKRDPAYGTMDLYYHISEPSLPFLKPVPLCSPDDLSQPVLNVRFLHCQTDRAYCQLGAVYHCEGSNCSVVNLTTGAGIWAGVLRLKAPSFIARKSLRHQGRINGVLCEVVEISRGSVQEAAIQERSFDEWRWRTEREFFVNGVYEFVNVLWIERKGNIAYRRALGRIRLSVWKNLPKDRVEITLG